MYKKVDWNSFQGVSVVSFHPEVNNTRFLKMIVENSKNVSTFRFSDDGIQELELAGSHIELASLCGQSAQIQNKYYKANVYFVEFNRNIPLSQIPEGYLHGTIIYFDNNDKESIDFAHSYVIESNVFLDDSSVKLLVCDTSRESDLMPRLEIQNLCINNGFELVELDPEIEEEDEDALEDDFKETLSFPRIYQALEANVWPHLEYVSDCSQSKHHNTNIPAQQNDLTEQKVDDFENLLYQFQDFKAKATNMDGEQRKEYAEKVAMMFFNSVCDEDDNSKDDD